MLKFMDRLKKDEGKALDGPAACCGADSGRKAALLAELNRELRMGEGSLDPLKVEALVDSLYQADAASPPRLSEEEVEDALARLKSRIRADRPRKGRFRLPSFRRGTGRARLPVRVAAGVFGVMLFALSANYVTALVSGACIAYRVEPRLCTGTRYCPCEVDAVNSGE